MAQRNPLQQLRNLILRSKQPMGLNTITDMQVLEGVILQIWAVPCENHQLSRQKPMQ